MSGPTPEEREALLVRSSGSAGRPLRFGESRRFDVAPGVLWDLLADTDHLNRCIGLPPVAYGAPSPRPGGLTRRATGRLFGWFSTSWKEFPFEWTAGRWYSVVRVFERGPIASLLAGLELHSEGVGSGLDVFCDIAPRWPFSSLVARWLARRSMAATIAYVESGIRRRRADGADPFPCTPKRPVVNDELLRARGVRLREMGAAPEVVALLETVIREGSDKRVLRLRPRALARRWEKDPEITLRTFLLGVRAGLLQASWDVLCPHCRVRKAEHRSLSRVQPRFFCDLCDRTYDSGIDADVELVFSPDSSVRSPRADVFCIGGPANAPHVLAQRRVPPGGTVVVELPETDAPLRLRSLGSNHIVALAGSEGAAEPLGLTGDGWSRSDRAACSPGRSLALENRTAAEAVVVVERSAPDADRLTAAEAALLPEFRDLLAADAPPAGRGVAVDRLAFLFVEAADFLRACDRLGEASAATQAARLFTDAAAAIRRHGGTVVRAAGDSLLSVFSSSGEAVRAALEARQEATRIDRREEGVLRLRLGLHTGTCLAVNADGRAGYVGKAPSVATRIARLGGEATLVLGRDAASDPEVEAVLAASGVRRESFEAEVEGLSGRMDLVRVFAAWSA